VFIWDISPVLKFKVDALVTAPIAQMLERCMRNVFRTITHSGQADSLERCSPSYPQPPRPDSELQSLIRLWLRQQQVGLPQYGRGTLRHVAS
jgi:hypothetical protein